MRASLLARATASTLWCSRFLAASIQGLSPWRAQLLGVNVKLDFAAYEAVESYRIDSVTPCACGD